MSFDTDALANVFRTLHQAYGPQHWWPAESPFEIAAGAVLVQRTAWRNAARAIEALRSRDLLEPTRLARSDPAAICEAIRPAGFAAAKSGYLRNLAEFFVHRGGDVGLGRLDSATLRTELLGVRGIGPETADAILLYLFGRPVWIADAYSVRILSRLSGEPFDARLQDALLQPWIDGGRISALQELHALIVEHGKRHCRVQALCAGCPLSRGCRFAEHARDDSAR